MSNSTRYRVVDFIQERILQAREVLGLQSIAGGIGLPGSNETAASTIVYDLNQIYRPGATQNITVTVTGSTVTFTPTNSSHPMVVFVRGRWEPILSGDYSTITLSTGNTNIYLNYVIRIVNSTEDLTLVDSLGNPTANMGELDLVIGTTDTHSTALNTSLYLEKNTVPIIMFSFTPNGSTYTLNPLDNVLPQALATLGISGLVSTTTSTCAGVVPGTDDVRMTNSRTPITGSVVNASVRTPVATGGINSADSSTKYDLTIDAGGISTDNIIYQEKTERLSDYLAYLLYLIGVAGSGVTSFNGRTGAVVPVGSSADYSYSMVGAAPSTHVGTQLGLAGSHLATVTTDTGGFVVNQDASGPTGGGVDAVTPNAAYGIFTSGTLLSGMLHNGDFLSTLLHSLVASPVVTPPVIVPTGYVAPTINYSGPLRGLGDVAQVLIDHVNQTSDCNPHGLTLPDLGGAAISYDFVANNGYIKFAIGTNVFMIQWGTMAALEAGNAPGSTFFFNPAFPNNCFGVYGAAVCPPGFDSGYFVLSSTPNISGFTAYIGGAPSARTVYWIAVGN
jgi:hypothetical protein